tara:strand:- start:1506 stop:1967 length:462 start_codon:yes stop_codon:yes gene_type:complete
MKDRILEKINSKDWKFHELLKLRDAAEKVAEELYHELEVTVLLEMIWDRKVGSGTWGSAFKKHVIEELEDEIMKAFQEKFESATVNFDEEQIPQVAEPAPEKPASLTDKYNKSEDPMKDLIEGKDVIVEEPPTLEEKDGMVKTRAGNVKVKRV